MNTGQTYDFNGSAGGGNTPPEAGGGMGGASFTQASIVPDVTPPPVDTSALILAGLQTLPAEQRDAMLASFVQHQVLGKKDDIAQEKERFELEKVKDFAKLKLYASIAAFGLIATFILVFGLTFAYLAMKKGMLNDGSIVTSLFGTMVEALRVILSTSAAY